MFDIGFSELLVIGVVALIVIGPERLPKVARTVGSLLGRLNRYVSQVKQDVERDMQLHELRKTQEEMKETAQRFEIVAEEASGSVKAEAGKLEQALEQTIGSVTAPATETVGEAAAEAHGDDSPKPLSEPVEAAPQQAQLELPLASESPDAGKSA